MCLEFVKKNYFCGIYFVSMTSAFETSGRLTLTVGNILFLPCFYIVYAFQSMKGCLADRQLVIRELAADTLCRVAGPDLEVLLSLALRAFEGADYRTRLASAHLIATVFSNSVKGWYSTATHFPE